MYNRFEKSLYDLIQGLRNHKGNEKAYIQNSLKECRAEIRGKDMGQFISQHCLDKGSLRCRRQSHRTSQACVPRNVRSRHVLGGVPCPRGYVVCKVFAEKSRLSWCCSELSTRHRSSYAGNQPPKEGMPVEIFCPRVLILIGETGPGVCVSHNDVPSHSNITAYHYLFPCLICSVRPSAPFNAFEPSNPEEDHRNLIPTSSMLP